MLQLAERQLHRQAVPIYQPDPVLRRTWVQAKTHGRTDARGLTANEIGRRQQRQQARRQADEERVADTTFIQQLQYAAANDTQLSTITVAPRRPSTPTPSSQAFSLLIGSPATPERPRPRRTPTPEASPLPTSAYDLPTSTAPPRLGGEKRRRAHTKKYAEARAAGLIAESQEAHKAERQG